MIRRKRKQTKIFLYDSEGACREAYALIDYPLPESAVRELSVLYFNDPEPCHIHRTAVQSRAMAELMQGRETGVQYPVNTLTELQQKYFDQNRYTAFSFMEEIK